MDRPPIAAVIDCVPAPARVLFVGVPMNSMKSPALCRRNGVATATYAVFMAHKLIRPQLPAGKESAQPSVGVIAGPDANWQTLNRWRLGSGLHPTEGWLAVTSDGINSGEAGVYLIDIADGRSKLLLANATKPQWNFNGERLMVESYDSNNRRIWSSCGLGISQLIFQSAALCPSSSIVTPVISFLG